MVAVVVGGDAEFAALCLPEQHVNTTRFLEQQFQTVNQMVGGVSDYAREFYHKAQSLYEQFNGSEAIRHARAVVRLAGGIFQRDQIVPMAKIEEFQCASLRQQRYLMAEPNLRELFHAQGCDGWSNTYVDLDPGLVGVNHYDWRRVYNGLAQPVVETDAEGVETHNWSSTTYFETLRDGDRDLTNVEQASMFSCHQVLKLLIKAGGEDPSSIFATLL